MTDKQIIDLTEIEQKYKDKCSLIKAGKCKNVNIFIEQSRKLKAKEQENEQLKVYKSITPLKVKMLVKTLTEIKEIAEKEVHTRMLFADKESFCDFAEILQKISEVEDD